LLKKTLTTNMRVIDDVEKSIRNTQMSDPSEFSRTSPTFRRSTEKNTEIDRKNTYLQSNRDASWVCGCW